MQGDGILAKGKSYDELVASFVWQVPAAFNMGVACCDRWADGSGRPALIFETAAGAITRYSFDDLTHWSNAVANLWRSRGLSIGDRVGILLPQLPETAVAHLAAYKSGAVAVPLFCLFGIEALQYRLADAGIRLLVTDCAGAAKIAQIRDQLPDLVTVFSVDGEAPGAEYFSAALTGHSQAFTPVATAAEDPALIIYTSGTTGKPKGALHAQRTLLGHLPCVETSHDLFPMPGDLIWTPADWAWIGGLMDVLMPALYHGVPVLARRFEKFEPEAAFDLMIRHGVRNVFLPPTALKLLRGVGGGRRPGLNLRSVASGGESLGAELLEWGREVLGVTINEFYGQTECNLVVSSCSALYPVRPGAIGRPVPGHRVEIVDDGGTPLPYGTPGNIAIKAPDPVMFLGYWNKAQATRDKFVGDYLLTGDQGVCEDGGYIRFVGRDDDVITSGGYRIGPGPIEDCLLSHPAVRVAAVVGVPDPERTEIVKAFLVLNDGYIASPKLTRELQDHVRHRLAAHEYPRAIRYLESLPMTTTGKIIRRELRALPE
ncbi:MAG: AMP-binding protein [Azospirillum sp.]|nr:AMP-binding protein [Azospirillum sp.]